MSWFRRPRLPLAIQLHNERAGRQAQIERVRAALQAASETVHEDTSDLFETEV